MDLNSLFMLLSIIAVFLMIPGLGFFTEGLQDLNIVSQLF
jgi:ammonia channel protein AmtB